MSRFAPTSMPRVGSSAMRTPGSMSSARANSSFCWLPPDSDPAGASRSGDPVTRSSASRTWRARRRAGRTRTAGSAAGSARLTFSRIGRRRISPSSLRDSGISATPAAIEAAGRPGSATCPRRDATGRRRGRAVDRPGQLGPAGPDQPGQPDDLARPERQRRVRHARRGQALDGEGDRCVGRRQPLVRVGPADRPAEHPGDEAVLGLVGGRVVRTTRPSRRTVTTSDRSRTSVRKCETRMTVRPRDREAADDLVEALGLLRRQARRRLVEDDEVGLARERAQDLDLLLLGERQVADDRVRPRGRSRRPRPAGRTARGATGGR